MEDDDVGLPRRWIQLKNVFFGYDHLSIHPLAWPAVAVEWLPPLMKKNITQENDANENCDDNDKNYGDVGAENDCDGENDDNGDDHVEVNTAGGDNDNNHSDSDNAQIGYDVDNCDDDDSDSNCDDDSDSNCDDDSNSNCDDDDSDSNCNDDSDSNCDVHSDSNCDDVDSDNNRYVVYNCGAGHDKHVGSRRVALGLMGSSGGSVTDGQSLCHRGNGSPSGWVEFAVYSGVDTNADFVVDMSSGGDDYAMMNGSECYASGVTQNESLVHVGLGKLVGGRGVCCVKAKNVNERCIVAAMDMNGDVHMFDTEGVFENDNCVAYDNSAMGCCNRVTRPVVLLSGEGGGVAMEWQPGVDGVIDAVAESGALIVWDVDAQRTDMLTLSQGVDLPSAVKPIFRTENAHAGCSVNTLSWLVGMSGGVVLTGGHDGFGRVWDMQIDECASVEFGGLWW